jgi:hypothetical protein
MENELSDETVSNLKDKIDALMEKGHELSKNLSVDEQYSIMKRLIIEGIDKAVQNIYKEEEIKFTDKELKEKKEGLEQFVKEYFDKRFSESIAKEWEKNH